MGHLSWRLNGTETGLMFAQSLQHDGWVRVDGLLDPGEVQIARERYRESLRDYLEDDTIRLSEWSLSLSMQVVIPWLGGVDSAPLAYHPRIAKLAADLLGVDRVRLVYEQAIHRTPGKDQTPWHQDCACVPADATRFITAWVPMMTVTPEMGTLRFATESHLHGMIFPHDVSFTERAKLLGPLIERAGFEVHQTQTFQPGDVLFYGGYVVHGSNRNSSETINEAVAITYVADGTIVENPVTSVQELELAQTMRGLQPGDLIAGPNHPIVFDRHANR